MRVLRSDAPYQVRFYHIQPSEVGKLARWPSPNASLVLSTSPPTSPHCFYTTPAQRTRDPSVGPLRITRPHAGRGVVAFMGSAVLIGPGAILEFTGGGKIPLADMRLLSGRLLLAVSSKFAIQSFDRSVAFAGARFERGTINDSDLAATVFDDASVL
jgi:hypothetical protein